MSRCTGRQACKPTKWYLFPPSLWEQLIHICQYHPNGYHQRQHHHAQPSKQARSLAPARQGWLPLFVHIPSGRSSSVGRSLCALLRRRAYVGVKYGPICAVFTGT
ncbi:unnamed protein product [Protopolystoma xenopodis]|uniref:Uncharacterized protein n=1 Tax=Protopolystoma xenopodis TaxID=117903 RepID=A0A448XQB1_9PLAT|nr:unnamed protein product [Protopolystoma xenopodis]